MITNSSSSSSSLLPPFSVKDKWNSLPLANIFTDPRVQHLFEQGFVVLKDLGRLDEKLRACAQQIADIICDLCPEICLELNDVMSFCGTFMTSSDENVSGDVVVHTVELDRRGGVVQEEGGGIPLPILQHQHQQHHHYSGITSTTTSSFSSYYY